MTAYPYTIKKIREEDGLEYFVARSTALNGCIGTGETQDEAIKELARNEVVWLETAKELGIEV